MYYLFGRVGTGHRQLRDGLKSWIVRQGERLSAEGAGADGGAGAARATATRGEGEGEGEAMAGAASKGKERESEAGATGAPATQTAVSWVTGVLDLKEQMDRLWRDAFASDKVFETTINEVKFVFVLFISPYLVSWKLMMSLQGIFDFCEPEPASTGTSLALSRRPPAARAQGQDRGRGGRSVVARRCPFQTFGGQGRVRAILQGAPCEASASLAVGFR
jgi:hypothetical protein